MNELTIEQLKSLEVGDWVWIVRDKNDFTVFGEYKFYARIMPPYIEGTLCYGRNPTGGTLRYSDYGTKWVAYKNKEQAEAKGDLYKTAFELILQDVYDNRLKADTLSCSSCPFMFELFDGCENQGLYEDCKKRWQDYYLAEAKRRLAELTKE